MDFSLHTFRHLLHFFQIGDIKEAVSVSNMKYKFTENAFKLISLGSLSLFKIKHWSWI